MAEIQLNKPLYKTSGEPPISAKEATAGPPPPRTPKPSLVARVGAVLIDVLVLHGALLLLIRLAPDPVVRLGWMGPVIGLIIGWAYLAVCNSHLCLGRTLGKLVMRIQLADVAGPDLPLGRSAARAAYLVSPLALFIVSGYVGEKYDRPEQFVAMPFIQVFAPLVAFGWLVANLFHAAFEPYGRTVYDRLMHSIIINAEADPEPLQEFLRGAREPLNQQELRKSRIAFAVIAALFLAIGSSRYFQYTGYLRELEPETREQIISQRQAFHVAGFGQPAPVAPDGQRMVRDKDTSAGREMEIASFEYRHRGALTADDVKQNPEAMAALDRVIMAHSGPEFQDRLFAHLNDVNKKLIMRGDLPTTAPQRLKFELTFAMQGDLFFARHSIPVLTETRVVRLDPGDPATSTPIRILQDEE